MARIGVFALNMSPRSGGVWSLLQGMMRTAHHSTHEFIFVRPQGAKDDLSGNVRLIERPAIARVMTQVLMNVPGSSMLLSSRSMATAALAAAGGFSPKLFEDADLWLWPHCFRVVPNLGPTAVICHDLIHRHCPEFFTRSELRRRTLGEASLRRCAGILCPSDCTANDLVSVYPNLRSRPRVFWPGPVQVIPETESESELRELDRRFGKKPLFLYVGVDWPHKNHGFLIDVALRLARMSSAPFHIVFAGHRRTGAIGELIRSRSTASHVTDLGTVSRPMLGALYRCAAALLFPSLFEGFGLPLVEAMQYRLPILASDRSCIPEVCGDGALLLPISSTRAWADAMLGLIESPAERQRLATASDARGREFTWKRTWSQLDRAFNEAMGAGIASSPLESAPIERTLVAAN